VLDRRPVLFLARRGAGVDHPTAAANSDRTDSAQMGGARMDRSG